MVGSRSAEDAAFVTKLKPVQSANLCADFSFDIDATPAQNQGNSDGVITIDNVAGNAPYNIIVSINGNQHTSGSYSALPIVIEDVQASVDGYDIVVSNADGCSNTASVLVAGCFGFEAVVTPQAATAVSSCDGTATVNISGSWGGPFNAESAAMLINTQFNSTSYLLSNTLCVGTGYIVTVTDGYGCQYKDTFDVTLGCTAPPVPVLTQSNDTLYASTVGVSGGYDWYLDGSILATTGFPVNYLVVTQNSSYTVIAGNGPCTSALSDPLVVTTAGIDEVTAAVASLYPNPAKETLTVYCDSPIKSIEVYSVLGARVLFKSGNVNSLDVSALANGMYSVRILTTAGQQRVSTFIKE